MQVGVVIFSRLNSSRLKEKALLEIHGKPLIKYIYERVSPLFPAEQIVVATSDQPSDDRIVEYCQQHAIQIYRGSLDNVAQRFSDCLQAFGFDFGIRLNGDNIFADTRTIGEMLEKTLTNEYDFLSNVKDRTFPYGMSVEIVRQTFYQKAFEHFSRPDHFELATKYFYDNDPLGNYYFHYNHICPEAKGLQLGINTIQEIDFARRIISRMNKAHYHYGLREIYHLFNTIR